MRIVLLVLAFLLLPTAVLGAELAEDWHQSYAEAIAESGNVKTVVDKNEMAHTKIEDDATTSDFTKVIWAKNMIEKICLALNSSTVVLSVISVPGGKDDPKTHTVTEATLDASTPCAYNLSRGYYYAAVTTNSSAEAVLTITTYQGTQ